MIRISRISIIFFLATATLLSLLATDAMGAPKALELNSKEKVIVKRIEKYFNGIKSLQARFQQFSSNGNQAQGKISILRPGMLRIEYDPPTPVEIIADGTWLIYNDKEMKQADHYPLGSTPANILVKKNISFTSGELMITRFDEESGVFGLTVAQSKDPEGELTLIFSDRPLTLRKWVVTDVQGVKTSVTLTETRFDAPLNPNMFKFIDPYSSGESFGD